MNNPAASPASSASPVAAARSAGGPLAGPLGIVVFVILFGAAGFLTYRTLFNPPPQKVILIPSDFLCIETNKHFEYAMHEDEDIPVISPYSGRRTGYPAEKCYWTRDGQRKSEPTFVVLNERLGKKGDTICPDCGRIVVGHNPQPPESIPLVDAPTTSQAADAPAPSAEPAP